MLVDDEEIRQKTTSCKPTQIFLWQDGLQCWSIEELKFFEIVLVQKMLRQRGAVLSAIILVLGLLGYFYFWHWSSDALLRRFNAASNSPEKLTLAVEVFSARLGNLGDGNATDEEVRPTNFPNALVRICPLILLRQPP